MVTAAFVLGEDGNLARASGRCTRGLSTRRERERGDIVSWMSRPPLATIFSSAATAVAHCLGAS